MNETKLNSRAKLAGVEPQLYVTNLDASFAFYERLGFEVAFTYGEPPFYAQIHRDGVSVNLRLEPTLPFDAKVMASEAMVAMTVVTTEAKQLFEEFQASGVAFYQGLKVEPWGAQTFIVGDLDGNLVLFAG